MSTFTAVSLTGGPDKLGGGLCQDQCLWGWGGTEEFQSDEVWSPRNKER